MWRRCSINQDDGGTHCYARSWCVKNWRNDNIFDFDSGLRLMSRCNVVTLNVFIFWKSTNRGCSFKNEIIA